MKNIKRNIVVYNKSDLKRTMEEMVKEQKIPLSIIFKHVSFLAGNRYFDVLPINEINSKMDKGSVNFNPNIVRELMKEFQSPSVNQKKFIEDFVDTLWVTKKNVPNHLSFKNKK